MRDCVILGSGRSGTSAMAGCFANAGYWQGERLLAPSASNPKGFFEDHLVNRVNQALLGSVAPHFPKGLQWLAVVPPGIEFDGRPFRDYMRAIAAHRPFCLKDPRFSYTLEAWRSVLEPVRVICMFRHPTATVNSILAHLRLHNVRGNLDTDDLYDTWLATYVHILGQEGERRFVEYDRLLVDRKIIRHLNDWLDTKLDRRILDRRLRHQGATNGDCPPKVQKVYDLLRARAL